MAKVQIRRMGVLSCAKIYSITLAAMGLILGVIYGLIFMVVGGAIMAGGGRESGAAGASSLVVGLVMMIAIPVFELGRPAALHAGAGAAAVPVLNE
jgi:hypothetical protein